MKTGLGIASYLSTATHGIGYPIEERVRAGGRVAPALPSSNQAQEVARIP